ncbi:MAG: ATPase [Nitrospirae bacterium CG18_big_fil_WC_8_21_14_2_50_70_55]|nr:ATPase [Deltaproteobacteria bacterium]OIP65058.1 MAG: hypothetical protein AUK30_05465 [Nitrospirae bacterium CG2_30_70_394]PIQ04345.1 MAG: ATPase [Nitrospirae bacterium CG18_big_fil_WC_8_21_14_2_50_70_55]PIU79058.1 MAG: ATPase [Nitrospirae bacterium CG06_land_8_20_14_3_00_70_43]PIW82449.1 MAG: ATPase [Nitrospirae bacterium CG_4_8_14_3_um_filter_70_85]PIX83555.1 MAG: ATPase [Nitrospirae bacterium CG_4_10_14_3_um_filter_70_108]PJB95459.1 MAG: ATPase [Nitrospirae bacterium CG_4_9_14_0_8_um_f
MSRPRTRTAYLDLRAEEVAFQEGYRFLDEMRLALAAEGVRELAEYDLLRARFEAAWARAVASLRRAVERHGIETPLLFPVADPAGEVAVTERSRLGVTLQEGRWVAAEVGGKVGTLGAPSPGEAAGEVAIPGGVGAVGRGGLPPAATPELRGCGAAWAALLPLVVPLAATTGNLTRLQMVYARTARRARALEELLLPEVAAELRLLADGLEEAEREDAVRVREAVTRRGPAS